MPKTSTGNKRASSASAKKSGLKKRFDLTNRKVQFFVVIAIVAVLGGGYLTVKSFANTVVRSWTGNQVYSNLTYGAQTCTSQPGTEPGKNSAPTLDIACSKPVGGYFAVPGMNQIATQAVTYQACVQAKGAGLMDLNLTAAGTNTYNQKHKLINDGSYHTYCSYKAYPAAGAKLDLRIWITPEPNGTLTPPPALVKILDVKLQQVSATTPAPTPAPSK